MDAMATILQEKGYDPLEVINRLKTFGAPEHLFERMTQATAEKSA
jgi:hypothetical protein